MAQFLETSCVAAFAKKHEQVKKLEEVIKGLKSKYLPILSPKLGERCARLEFGTYACLVIRCAFGKSWPQDMQPKVTLPPGKFSEEKVKSLGEVWAKSVDLKYPDVGFAAAAGLLPKEVTPAEEAAPVQLEQLRDLKRRTSAASEPDSAQPAPEPPLFKRGDRVSVVRRFTWRTPTKENPEYKKDLPIGTEWVIEGWADDQATQVLLTVTLNMAGTETTLTREAHPRNLQLTTDYLLKKVAESRGPEAPAEPEEPGLLGFKWLLGSSAPCRRQGGEELEDPAGRRGCARKEHVPESSHRHRAGGPA